jgi:WD40 repeat protein
MIDCINSDNPLTLVPSDIQDQGAVTGMTLSDDGTMLVTFCNIGCVKIWDIRKGFKCLRHIRDKEEKQIDEFYCGQLLPGTGLLATGGKLKNRHRWSAEDNDNHILPCPIKIFDVFTGKRVAKLEGHTEEILCIKAVKFEGENYLISTSQDGYIIKWHMDKDWE